MIYRLPEIKDQKILMDYVEEHYAYHENHVNASMELTSSNYEEWVEKIQTNALTGDDEWGKSSLYLCFDEEQLVGLLSIRYELSQSISEIYGNVGYGVRPSKRNKGYATAMLKHALEVCKQKGMSEVILGCYKDNLASAATIKKCGGILYLECDHFQPGKMSQYYRIKL